MRNIPKARPEKNLADVMVDTAMAVLAETDNPATTTPTRQLALALHRPKTENTLRLRQERELHQDHSVMEDAMDIMAREALDITDEEDLGGGAEEEDGVKGLDVEDGVDDMDVAEGLPMVLSI